MRKISEENKLTAKKLPCKPNQKEAWKTFFANDFSEIELEKSIQAKV
ncbi:hypothetical protein [Thiolinea disciformis]|nr:hypothetical protein [Thiolinea disciformis]